MVGTNLADLDDLVLTVRDRDSRLHISEAVSAYRARAYRSAIMSTWVAVAADLLGKIRELAEQGEREAIAHWKEFEDARFAFEKGEGNALAKLQTIERELLDRAHKSYDFLSQQEYGDLIRLRDDRHRCAHPAFSTNDQLFQPTSELVRAHIVHSIFWLLQHPPVQGRTALARLRNDLLSQSFPTDQDSVTKFLDLRYMKSIKKRLTTNFLDVLLKAIIKSDDVQLRGKEQACVHCIMAFKERHPDLYRETVSATLKKLLETTNDSTLCKLHWLLAADHGVLQLIPEDQRMQVHSLLKNGNLAADDGLLLLGLSHPDFSATALDSLKTADFETLEGLLLRKPHKPFASLAVDLLLKTRNYSEVNATVATVVRPLEQQLSEDDVARLLAAIPTHPELNGAHSIPKLLLRLFNTQFAEVTSLHYAWHCFADKVSSGFDDLKSALEAKGVYRPSKPTSDTDGADIPF